MALRKLLSDARTHIPGVFATSPLSISSGTTTVSASSHQLVAESGDADDVSSVVFPDIWPIGVPVQLRAEPGHTITLKSTGGNLSSSFGDVVLAGERRVLVYKTEAGGALDERPAGAPADGGSISASSGLLSVQPQHLYTLTAGQTITGVDGLADRESFYFVLPGAGEPIDLVDDGSPASGQAFALDSDSLTINPGAENSVFTVTRTGSVLRLSGSGAGGRSDGLAITVQTAAAMKALNGADLENGQFIDLLYHTATPPHVNAGMGAGRFRFDTGETGLYAVTITNPGSGYANGEHDVTLGDTTITVAVRDGEAKHAWIKSEGTGQTTDSAVPTPATMSGGAGFVATAHIGDDGHIVAPADGVGRFVRVDRSILRPADFGALLDSVADDTVPVRMGVQAHMRALDQTNLPAASDGRFADRNFQSRKYQFDGKQAGIGAGNTIDYSWAHGLDWSRGSLRALGTEIAWQRRPLLEADGATYGGVTDFLLATDDKTNGLHTSRCVGARYNNPKIHGVARFDYGFWIEGGGGTRAVIENLTVFGPVAAETATPSQQPTAVGLLIDAADCKLIGGEINRVGTCVRHRSGGGWRISKCKLNGAGPNYTNIGLQIDHLAGQHSQYTENQFDQSQLVMVGLARGRRILNNEIWTTGTGFFTQAIVWLPDPDGAAVQTPADCTIKGNRVSLKNAVSLFDTSDNNGKTWGVPTRSLMIADNEVRDHDTAALLPARATDGQAIVDLTGAEWVDNGDGRFRVDVSLVNHIFLPFRMNASGTRFSTTAAFVTTSSNAIFTIISARNEGSGKVRIYAEAQPSGRLTVGWSYNTNAPSASIAA